jgi:RNA polymerase sigma factor (sigma-70 family)
VSPWLSGQLLRSLTDERLAALVGEGHDRAFALLVERYRRSLLSFARGLGAGGRAEDIVQQAFMQAWVALHEGVEVTHVRGWLHQITRRATSRAAVPLTDELPATLVAARDTESEVERRLETQWLLTALDDLPERQRDALVQTALHGRTGLEVADGLGLSENALRQLLFRARTTLRAAAGAVLPGPLVTWAAACGASSGPMGERVAELVGAGGSAGVMAGVVKTAAIVVAAGTAVAGGTAVHHDRGSARHGSAATLTADSSRRALPVASGAVVATASVTPTGRASAPTAKPARSTPGAGSAPGRPQRHVLTRGTGSQSSQQTSSQGGSSGARPHGAGTSDDRSPTAERSPEPGGSGSGSGGSGSGSSGSGSGGSGSSGSGSSGSDSGSGGGGQGPSGPDSHEALQASPAEVQQAQPSSEGSGDADPHSSSGPGSGSGSGGDDMTDDALP